MSPQEIAVGLSLLTVAGTAINVFVGLRLAAMQAKLKSDTSALEVALVKQFVAWKDEVLATINGLCRIRHKPFYSESRIIPNFLWR